MFHVEHAPIQKPAAPTRAFLEQLVDFGIDDLGWKLFRQVRNAGGRSATDAPLGIAARRTNAQGYGSHRPQGLRGQDEIICPVRDERIPTAGAE